MTTEDIAAEMQDLRLKIVQLKSRKLRARAGLESEEQGKIRLELARARDRFRYLKGRDRCLDRSRKLYKDPDFVTKQKLARSSEEFKARNRERDKTKYATDPKVATRKKLAAAKYREENADKCKVTIAKWRAANPKYASAYIKKKRRDDIVFALKLRLRNRFRQVLNGGRKHGRSIDLVGCSWLELKEHIEKQFKPGMTWENRSEWHVDHKLPCKMFDLTDPEQQRKCFHFSNLQPLWAQENWDKNAKILPEHLLTP